MEKITLEYFGKDIEAQYRQMLYVTQFSLIRSHLCFLEFALLTFIMYNVLLQSPVTTSLIVAVVYFTIILLIITFIHHLLNVFDWIMLFIQISLNSIYLFIRFFEINDIPYDGFRYYFAGYTMAYMTQCLNLGSRTILKQLAIIINVLLLLFLQLIQTRWHFCIQHFILIISGVMYLVHIQYTDRQKRNAYLIQSQQEMWEQNLDEVGEIAIIQCKFDKKFNSIGLYKANKIAQFQFYIKDEISMREFYRNFVVLLPHATNQHKEEKIQLEKLLYYLFTEDKSKQNLIHLQKHSSTSQPNFSAKGIYQQTNYKIQIFSYWGEDRISVIQISKFEETLEVKTLKFKLQICKMIIHTYQQQLQVTLVPSIALIKQLAKSVYLHSFLNQQPAKTQKNIQQLMYTAEYRLYESFRQNLNIMIFFKPKFQFKLQIFEPDKVIYRVVEVLKHRINLKGFKIIAEQSPVKYLVTSNYQLFHQLIMNILEQIMKVSKTGGEIYILHQITQSLPSDKFINFFEHVEFDIMTDAITASEILENQIWVLNPLSLKNCRRVSYNKSLNINLCISHYIVGLLGPFSKIEYLQRQDQMCTIRFRIYKNLKEVKLEINRQRHGNPPPEDSLLRQNSSNSQQRFFHKTENQRELSDM